MDTQRGRKGQKVSLVPLERPEPPAELDADQRAVWEMTVNRLPADWFPAETHKLLTNYCRQAVTSDRLAERIAQAEREHAEPKELDLLLKMRDRELRGMSSLATRMRLTQQSSYDANKSKGDKRKADGAKPWQRATS